MLNEKELIGKDWKIRSTGPIDNWHGILSIEDWVNQTVEGSVDDQITSVNQTLMRLSRWELFADAVKIASIKYFGKENLVKITASSYRQFGVIRDLSVTDDSGDCSQAQYVFVIKFDNNGDTFFVTPPVTIFGL